MKFYFYGSGSSCSSFIGFSDTTQPSVQKCSHAQDLHPEDLFSTPTYKFQPFWAIQSILYFVDKVDTMIKPPLSVGYGYGIVLGLGFLFAFGKWQQTRNL
jgi:hypothetical protein